MFQIVPFGQLVSTMLRVAVKSFKGISWISRVFQDHFIGDSYD